MQGLQGVLGSPQPSQSCSWSQAAPEQMAEQLRVSPAAWQLWGHSYARGDFSQGEFVISPVEGELRVRKDAELDRENIPFYNLTIAARDRGVPPLSSTMVVGVRVLDINDNDPVLLNLPMNLTLSEHAPVSSFVTRVLARDADKGPNALLTFDITAGNAESAFYINSTTGIIYVNRPLDRERVAEYRLTITVKDNPENIRNARRDFDLLVISIADENDNHPLFTQSSYQAEVMENSPPAGRPNAVPGPRVPLCEAAAATPSRPARPRSVTSSIHSLLSLMRHRAGRGTGDHAGGCHPP